MKKIKYVLLLLIIFIAFGCQKKPVEQKNSTDKLKIAVSVAPLAYLFVSEVVQLGLDLGLPEDLVRKAPSDGMCGMTDEDKLGFTYAELQNVATGKADLVEKSKADLIKSKLDAIAWKRRLLNLPCFVPSNKNIADWS